ncbi:MAG: thiamine-phosphate kinase [Actinomycetota bacterium]|jgi:thiamine-monophosphate kinase|nr:thiamine-phosphate kinase [Actinomycetota bacterium]
MAEGEFDLIRRLAPFLAADGEGLIVGHGDDAAVVEVGGRGVCIAVDVLVEGVHFRRDLSSLNDVGWKAVAVNVSDIAAMGAAPTVAVVGLCRPSDVPVADIEALYAGMDEACRHWGLRLVGGDTVAAEALALSVTVLGDVDVAGAVRRSGANPGDRLVVVGTLGAAAAALALDREGLEREERLLARHRRPEALVDAGRRLAQLGATAMIDVSDGFGADLGHVCAASQVSATVDAEALPAADGVVAAAIAMARDPLDFVCGGGDDYALLAAVPSDRAEAVAVEVGGVVVGEVGEGPVVTRLLLADGSTRDLAGQGWDHYRQEPA